MNKNELKILLSFSTGAVFLAALAVDGYFGFNGCRMVYEYFIYPLLILIVLVGALVGAVWFYRTIDRAANTKIGREALDLTYKSIVIIGVALGMLFLLLLFFVMLMTIPFLYTLLITICVLLITLLFVISNKR